MKKTRTRRSPKAAASRSRNSRSSTTTVNVSMPAQLEERMRLQMVHGGFENVSEYVRSLIRDNTYTGPTNRAELYAEIMRGVNSPHRPVTPDTWKRLAAKIRAAARQRKAG